MEHKKDFKKFTEEDIEQIFGGTSVQPYLANSNAKKPRPAELAAQQEQAVASDNLT